MPQFFKPEQEDAFLQWEQAHPHGFFVNSSPGRWNPKYLVAHDIGCSSVHRHKGRMLQYSKHCFESVEEFFQFFEQQGGSLLRYSCQQCKIARRFATNDFSQLQYLAKLLRTSYEVEGKQMPMPKGLLKPEKRLVQARAEFVRDPSVVAWVLDQAKGRCECCGTSHTFLTDSGQMYLEVHHVVPLAEGGPDTPQNAVAVCPTCHRALHYASDRQERREKLYGSLERLRRPQRR